MDATGRQAAGSTNARFLDEEAGGRAFDTPHPRRYLFWISVPYSAPRRPAMPTLREQDEKSARKKGIAAAATAAGAVALGTVAWPLGVVAAIPAAWLGYDWFMYRAKRGMRF
jgi:hypothetical protein